MRWIVGIGVFAASFAGAWAAPATSPDQTPSWSIQVDWNPNQLLALAEAPHPDSLEAPGITMLRNDYETRGGFPLRELSLKALFQIQEDAGRVAVGAIHLPARFDGQGHVIGLDRPRVYQDIREPARPRRQAQLVGEHAYYQDGTGRYLCRSFATGEVDTLPFVGTLFGYSEDRSRALLRTTTDPARGLVLSYYDLSVPPAPRLLWAERLPNALSYPLSSSIAPGGDLVAMQYVDGALQLKVVDAAGRVRLQHAHGPGERPNIGVQFISPTELLEGYESGATMAHTAGLSVYRITK